MPTNYAASIRSVGSKLNPRNWKRRDQSSKPSNKSPFTRTERVEVPSPAPVKTGPEPRSIKPEEAKAETKGTDIAKGKEKAQEDSANEDSANQVVATVHGPVTPIEVKTNQADKPQSNPTREKQTVERTTTKGAYAKVWAHVQSEAPHGLQYTEYSHYTPNGVSIFAVQAAAEKVLSGHIDLEWKQRKFLTLPVRLYLATMYYVRILMVKEALRRNSPADSTWLRKFLREFPLASLPLPGYLMPLYQAICAYAVDEDSRQTWVYPDLPANIYAILGNDTAAHDVFRLSQPNPAQLFDIMRMYVSDLDMANEDAFTDPRGNFVIHNTATDFHLGGKEIHALNGNVASARDEVCALAGPALNEPFPESYSEFLDRRRHWKNSMFRRYALQAPPAHVYASLPEFLNLHQNMDWFNECISMTRVMMNYFTDGTNFGELDYEGGPETTIFTDLTFSPGLDNQHVPNFRQTHWYPLSTELAHTSLTIYQPDVSMMCYNTAKYALMNSKLTFRVRTQAANNGAVTELVANTKTAVALGGTFGNYHARAGPFFGTYANGDALEKGATTTVHKFTERQNPTVLSGYEDMIRGQFYIPGTH